MIDMRTLFHDDWSLRDCVFVINGADLRYPMQFNNDDLAGKWMRAQRADTHSVSFPCPLYKIRVKLTDAYREARHDKRTAIQHGRTAEEIERAERRARAFEIADAPHVKSYQARRARDMD